MENRFKFLEEKLISSSNFKGLSPSNTPFHERKNLVLIVNPTIHQLYLLSTPKLACENYLLKITY